MKMLNRLQQMLHPAGLTDRHEPRSRACEGAAIRLFTAAATNWGLGPLASGLTATLVALIAVGWLAGCTKNAQRVTNVPGFGPSYIGDPASLPGSPAARSALNALPGSLPSPAEELWVISRTRPISAPSGQPAPGSGSMLADLEHQRVPMPLKHTDVKAIIDGYIATAKVLQRFHNPYDQKIEAIYVFPLPENAAVNEFIMTIGERRIRGVIREREEAEKIYAQAKQQGHVASLLTQERPNIFTQSVANIEPGREIDVTIQYFHTLAYADGWYEFVFPMVVGPRFNPPGSKDGVGTVPRGASGASGQKTEVSYLAPHERSGHDIALQVDLHAGVAIEETRCPSHETTIVASSPESAKVKLSPNDSIPNKDFVLRYRVAGDRIKSNLLTHRDERGGFFTLMLYPPAELRELSRRPLELVFVLDCSGSMNGRPLAQAKAAIERALQRLQPGDSFQLINFSMSAAQLGPAPLEATPENIRRGLAYLRSLNSEGGTMMIEGIKAALDFPHDPERLRFVAFLTDGYIGNEIEIFAAVHQRLGASRVFSFGVGSSVNRYLLDGLARAGRGAVAYLALEDNAAQVMDDFLDRISHPALTDVRIEWDGMKVDEIYPHRIPDLFVGRPVVLTGRFQGEPARAIRVTGRADAGSFTMPVEPAPGESQASPPALPSVWARMKIADLADQSLRGRQPDLSQQIKQLALDFNLMSAFTAFIAVDSATRTGGDPAVTVPVAVPVPAGVNPKTTVRE